MPALPALPTPQPTGEHVVFSRPRTLPGVELLRATYIRQSFARHFHEGYALGVIERGALAFSYRGAKLIAPAGRVNLTVPGEPHDGHAAGAAGWTYSMFYLDAAVLRQAGAALAPGRVAPPHFEAGVLDDPALCSRVLALHHLLARPEVPRLAQESLLLDLLAFWILRHAENRPDQPRFGRERRAVALARDCIEARAHEDLRLADLAGLAGLSPYHFLRVFQAETGVTPHAYLVQARVRQAQSLLAKGLPLAEAAAVLGFADQSHLTRSFKRIVGLTPGQYRNFLQDR